MNKLFKRTLALLACMALIGQTMLTSVVSAVEVGDDYVSEENVVDELVVENDVVDFELMDGINNSTKIINNSKVINDVDELLKDVVNVKTDSNEKNQDSGDEWSLSDLGDGSTSNLDCSKGMSKFADAINDYLDVIGAEDIKAYGYDETNEVIIEYENDIDDLTPYIEAMKYYLLNETSDNGLINNLGGLFRLNENWVTALIDLKLDLELNINGDYSASTTRDIEGRVKSVLSGCKYDNVVVRIEKKEPKLDVLGCTKVNVEQDKLKDIANNFKGYSSKGFTASSDETSVYVNNSDLEFSIDAVTSLIDYLLTKPDSSINYEPKEGDLWSYVWASIHNATYELTITDVTTIIDLLLEGKSVGAVVIPMTSYDGKCFNLVLGNAGNGSNVDWDNMVCTKADLKKEDLRKIADNFDEFDKGFEASSDDLSVYVKNNNLDFNIGVVTSLIDYLLNNPSIDTDYMPKEGDSWSYVWASIHNARYELTMDDVTTIIDMLLLGVDKTKEIVIPLTVRNSGCFNLVIGLKGNGGNGDNNPGYSGGGSSGGGSSSSSNSSIDNEELEFGGEVVEPEDTDTSKCSVEGSTYSDEENQAYLWACEKGILPANNIMKSNLSSPLTRAELDKMMSIYSKQLLGRSYVVNETVSYPDVDSKLGNLAYYIQEGYKLQIMGIHANGVALNNFLPNLLVTRGEFGTVFSRVLYGNRYNIDGANYYEKHLQVLKDAGILTNTNPTLTEARGWVVLMLYRSQKVEESNGTISNEEIASITAEENVETVEENTTAVEENTENVENPTETPSEEAQN